MAQISPDYASPGLRLGLLLHDHPNAHYDFKQVKGTELGIPANFGGEGDFCLATIHFGDGRADASAWKPVPPKGDAELWNVLQTKTLGRALKKAGYPDDLRDLKALVLWRQRDAEISAIVSGTQQVAIASTTARQPQGALASGSVDGIDEPAPDALEQALTEAATAADDDAVDADIVDERAELVAELVEGLDGRTLKTYLSYLKTAGIPEDPFAMSSADISDALAWLDPDAD